MDGNGTAIVLASGSDVSASVHVAMERVAELDPRGPIEDREILVVVPDNTAESIFVADDVAGYLRGTTGAIRVVRPPHGLIARLGSRKAWTAIDVSARAERLERVLIPRSFAEAAALVGVAPWREGPRAIGLWTSFVHPRLAIGARLAGAREGFGAEIALAFAPWLVVLHGRIGDQSVVVAGSDLVALELVGLALRTAQLGPDVETVGPWEHPLVQRATELRLGVQHPGDLTLVTAWAGRASDRGAMALETLAERVRVMLGIGAT